MALRLLQFSLVCAIGRCIPVFSQALPTLVGAGSNATIIMDIPLSLDVEPLEDVVVVRGQPTTLHCRIKIPAVTGTASSAVTAGLTATKTVGKLNGRRVTSISAQNNNVTIEWFHNHQFLDVDSNDAFQQSDNSLHIVKVLAPKEGTSVHTVTTGNYTCLATNQFGSVLSNTAKVSEAYFDDDFSRPPTNQTINEGQPAILNCDIHSFPSALVQWERNGQLIPQSTRYVPLPLGALLISQTHSSDEGSYRCTARNYVLEKSKISQSVQLTVINSQPHKQPPVFLPLFTVSDNVVALVNERQPTRLFCITSGYPIPTTTWFKDNIIVGRNSSVFVLANVTLEDAGTYTCVAQNSLGEVSRDFDVNVYQKPNFIIRPTSRRFPPAQIIRLDCKASGVPNPKIMWLKNGQLVQFDGRVKSTSNGLIVGHSFSHDSAIYQCCAINVAGQSCAAAQVTPISRNTPSPPQSVHCRPYDEHSICLTWQSPPNVTIQGYNVVSIPTGMSPEHFSPECVANVTFCLLSGVKPDTNYTFYIRLYAKVASDASERVTCQSGLRGKRNLEVTRLNITTVHLKWDVISTDVPCQEPRRLHSDMSKNKFDEKPAMYKVQWKKRNRSTFNMEYAEGQHTIISGLLPSVWYEFRVVSTSYKQDPSPWVPFILSTVNGQEQPPSSDAAAAPQASQASQTLPSDGVGIGRDIVGDASSNSGSSRRIDTASLYGNRISAENESFAGSNNAITDHGEIIENPEILEGISLSPKSVNVSWRAVAGAKFYTLCYAKILGEENPDCEDEGTTLQSITTHVLVENLKPKTLYMFCVRVHDSDNAFGPYSRPIEVETPSEVPSAVLRLNYTIINETCVCLHWRAPVQLNGGKLLNYEISYTPDRNWPLDKWYRSVVSVQHRRELACLTTAANNGVVPDEFTFSLLLDQLDASMVYTVLVRAGSNLGIGNPTLPISVTTNWDLWRRQQQQLQQKQHQQSYFPVDDHQFLLPKTKNGNTYDDQDSNSELQHKIGILIGGVASLLCVITCVALILLRRRCVKRGSLSSRSGDLFPPVPTNHGYPSIVRYGTDVVGDSGMGRVQVRLDTNGRRLIADLHEMQHLVVNDEDTHMRPLITTTYIDTKNMDGVPNGHCVNGRKSHLNGHIPKNDSIHITENPRCLPKSCNDGEAKRNICSLACEDEFDVMCGETINDVPNEEDDDEHDAMMVCAASNDRHTIKEQGVSKFIELQRIFENGKRNQRLDNKCNRVGKGRAGGMRAGAHRVKASSVNDDSEQRNELDVSRSRDMFGNGGAGSREGTGATKCCGATVGDEEVQGAVDGNSMLNCTQLTYLDDDSVMSSSSLIDAGSPTKVMARSAILSPNG